VPGKRIKVDPVVSGCLQDIRVGRLADLGILADRLEETDAPQAQRIRRIYLRWQKAIGYCRRLHTRDFYRRRGWTRWEALAAWHCWARTTVAEVFGRRWDALPLLTLFERNEAEASGDGDG
jgi:hypothetical protein